MRTTVLGCAAVLGLSVGCLSPTGSGSSTSGASSSTSGGTGCLPGASVACVGVGGCQGGQICNPDGRSLGACQCQATSSSATGGSSGGSGSMSGGSSGSSRGLSSSVSSGSTSSGGASSGSSGSGLACQNAGGTTCATVADCPNATNFTCDPNFDCCVFFCNTLSDCGGPSDPGDPCVTSSLGCVCEQGVCLSKQCSASVDCRGVNLVCKGGNCQAPDSPSSAATIIVQPNPAILHVGAAQQFKATVLDSGGAAVILAAGGVTWSVSGNGSITQAGTLTPTTGSTGFGDTTITATVGAVSGTAIGTIYAAPASGGVQLTLIDGAASIPIIDATVEYTNDSGILVGTPVTAGDALGRYAPGAPPSGAVLLDVFEPNYQYVSVGAASLPASKDIVLFLEQNPVTTSVGGAPQPVVGGVTGEFQQTPGVLDPTAGEPVDETGYIHIGVAGTALPQNPLDLSIEALFGSPHDVTINIGGSHVEALAQGVELGFGDTYFSCSYDGLGPAGGCGLPPCTGSATGSDGSCLNDLTDPTNANWPYSVFACGQRPAWGLGGGVPFSEISTQLGALGSGSVGFLPLLLPDFNGGFESAIAFQAPYTLQPEVPANQVDDACTGAPFTDATPIPDPSQLNGKVTLALATPLANQAVVTLPPLPSVGTGGSAACQQTALVLAGAIQPGSGLLPLGLSEASIVDANGVPSPSCEIYSSFGVSNGSLFLNSAPEHGGLEGDTYVVVALSLDASGLSGGAPGAMAGLVQTFTDMPFGQSVTFPGVAGFPAYLQNATYNPNNRTFANDTTNGVGATWEQLRFQDDLGRQWVTYFAPGTASFVLPVPPTSCGAAGSCADRTLTTTGSLASPTAQQVVTSSATTVVSFLDFTNGPVAESLLENVVGFSAVGIGCPAGVTGGGC